MFIQQMGYFQHIKRLFRKVQYQMQVMHIFLYLILNRKACQALGIVMNACIQLHHFREPMVTSGSPSPIPSSLSNKSDLLQSKRQMISLQPE